MLGLEGVAAAAGQHAPQVPLAADEADDLRPTLGHPVFLGTRAAGMDDHERLARADAGRAEEFSGLCLVFRRQLQGGVLEIFFRPRRRYRERLEVVEVIIDRVPRNHRAIHERVVNQPPPAGLCGAPVGR